MPGSSRRLVPESSHSSTSTHSLTGAPSKTSTSSRSDLTGHLKKKGKVKSSRSRKELLTVPSTVVLPTETLAFQFLTQNEAEGLLSAIDVDHVQFLTAGFRQPPFQMDKTPDAVTLDFYVAGLWWAKTKKFFPADKLSGFFTIMKTLLENIKVKQLNLVENITDLKWLMCRGLGRQPHYKKLFTTDDARDMTDYLNLSLFQHYKLYEFCFQTETEVILTSSSVDVEVVRPFYPPPLAEACDSEVLQDLHDGEVALRDGEVVESITMSESVSKMARVWLKKSKKKSLSIPKVSPDLMRKLIQEEFHLMTADLEGIFLKRLHSKETKLKKRIKALEKKLNSS